MDGGMSSDIRIVRSPHGDHVIKRALGKLKVEADWFSDPTRSAIEVDGLRVIAELLGQQHVPRVLWTDAPANRFAMALIDDRFRNWKHVLLHGEVDMATARAAGRLLGQLHHRSSQAPDLAHKFANTRPFDELRIRPFFERIAQKNPHLAPAIIHTIEHIRSHRMVLVHGDYSPKNLLVCSGDVVILDCEVAHWGDPRFDVAFCVAHLLLKSFRRTAPTARLLSAAHVFVREYLCSGVNVIDLHFVQQLGCLLLARLEGDSPVDYLDDLDTIDVRQFASELIVHPTTWRESVSGDMTEELP